MLNDYNFMTRKEYLYFLFPFISSLLCFSCSTETENKPPNVILIQVDDLGFDDLSLHGNSMIETPNIDALGEASVQFDNFYLQSVCAPSRAALLTGRNFLKTGVTSVHGGRDYMNLDETLISQVFQSNGYKTGMWGKWHSGKTDGYLPWDRGFDEAYYSCLYNYFDNTGLLNGQEVNTNGYTTDALTDMAISFIKSNKEQPFFAYISHLAPHNPWRAPQENVDKYLAKGLSEPMSLLYGMIDNLDENIGRVMQTVEEQGLTENTIIVFLSDNGPWTKSYRFGLTEEEWKLRNPSAFRGYKGTNWENGVKSPLFIKFGKQLTSTHIDRVTKIEDLFPSLVAMCHLPLPDSLQLDGIDFSPIFDKKEVPDSELVFASHSPKGNIGTDKADKNMSTPSEPLTPQFKESFIFENQGLAYRKGEWKFIQNQDQSKKELYHVISDPRETKNLIAEQPEIAKSLEKELEKWYDDVLASKSYNMPVFQIGFKGRTSTQIYTCGPSEISQNLKNNNHNIENWSAKDDQATYDIKVHTEGTYNIFLVHEIEDFQDYSFSLSTNNASTSVTRLEDNGGNDFGTLIEGESAYWENFDLKSTFRKTIKRSNLGSLQLKKNDSKIYLTLNEVTGTKNPKNTKIIAIQLERVKDE